eukprot:jgi/Botrbrau1/8986/Bobra.0148s0092.1
MDMFEVDAAPRDNLETGFRAFGSPSPGFFQTPGSRVSPGALGPSALSIPTYRPSPVPVSSTGSPLRAGEGSLLPSSMETVAAAERRVGIPNKDALHEGMERLRHWLASHLLHPLWMLSPLPTLMWRSAWPPWVGQSSNSSPRAEREVRPGEGDQEDVLQQLREHLQTALPPRAPVGAQSPALQTCLQALKRYQRLSALVKGEHPRALLGPVPRGLHGVSPGGPGPRGLRGQVPMEWGRSLGRYPLVL